jgi:type III secretion protein Q
VSRAGIHVAALAAALVPGRAAALLARHVDAGLAGAAILSGASREERMAALAEALRGAAPVDGGTSAEDTPVRAAARREGALPAPGEGTTPARVVLSRGGVPPFDLPSVDPALAELTPDLCALGVRVARCAASGVASVLGGEVSIRGRLLPGIPEPGGSALFPIELVALAGKASLAVECSFAARLADHVAGGAGAPPPATSLSPAQRAVVELAVLGALDAVASEADVEGALAPRLGTRPSIPDRPVCVEVSVTAAGAEGRALLCLPAAALRALRGTPALPAGLADVPVPVALRVARAEVDPDDLARLAPGDVLALDPSPGAEAALLLPEGVEASGRLDGDALAIDALRDHEGRPIEGPPPVVLGIEFASVSLPLGEVSRIAPGAVLGLGLDRRGLVRLRIGDRDVARGELVDVDGALGVRITSVEGAR